MSQFRTIDYGRMLYEALRAYFSVNASGQLSILYKYLFACIYPLQSAFINYDTFRIRAQIIANCKWQIGQMTNVLNHFFDPIRNRIYISQATQQVTSDPVFGATPKNYDSEYGQNNSIANNTTQTTPFFEPSFGGYGVRTNVIFNIPSTLDLSAIKAVIEQVKISGINYTIQTF